MSRSLYRLSLLIILTAAGCAWQQETIVPPQPGQPSAIVDIEIDSSLSLSGIAQGEQYVYPNNRDSEQYIIVNGVIVWASSPAPYYLDSISTFHADGTKNTINIVWPSVTQTDTESIALAPFQILSPLPGDTIVRANGVTITYPVISRTYSRQIDLDDGIDTIGFAVDTTGSFFVADTSLAKLSGPWVRITYNIFTNWGGISNNNFFSSSINAYRSIQYPMK